MARWTEICSGQISGELRPLPIDHHLTAGADHLTAGARRTPPLPNTTKEESRGKVKLFTTGGSRAVRLPAEFRFEGDEVDVQRDSVTEDVVL